MKKALTITTYLTLSLMLLSSCSWFGANETQKGIPVARVGSDYLYKEDLKGLTNNALNSEDSTSLIHRYIDLWINRKLLLAKAKQEIVINEAELERRMEEYKFQLVLYDYEKSYLQQNLDTAITQEQIKQYYDENQDNFVLKGNIIQGVYLKVPNEAPDISKLRNWLNNWDQANRLKIKDYALQYADDVNISDSLWTPVNDIVANTPFRQRIETNPQILRPGNLLQVQDTAYHYLLRINSFKLSEDVSPLSFVSQQVKDIILNRRKLELIKRNEQQILKEAKQKRQYEIFE